MWVLGFGGKVVREEEEEERKSKEKRKSFLGIFFPPRVCDQVAALAEGLSTDYALVRLFP